MNKVFNINLGGLPFAMDDNAFEALTQYINGLRQHFSGSEGCDEIVGDIEARIAELFSEYLGGRKIVSLPDVKRAMSVMGVPMEIDQNASAENINTEQKNTYTGAPKSTWRSGKRLFRNPDDKIIGGVCSGLSAYFGINEPIWMRLAFVVGVLFAGIGFLPYLLLLIIMPKARTAADRLAMRGEAINVSTIAQSVEGGFSTLGDEIDKVSNNLQERFGSRPKTDGSGNNPYATSSSTASDNFADIIKVIIKLVIACILGSIILSLVVAWFGTLFALGISQPYWGHFTDSPSMGWIGSIAVFCLVTIPLIWLILLSIKLFYKIKLSPILNWGLGLTWIGSLLTLIILATTLFGQYKSLNSVEKEIDLRAANANSLSVIFDENNDDEDGAIHFGNFQVGNNDVIRVDDIGLDIEPSDDAQFHLVQKNSAWARTFEAAGRAAGAIEYTVTQTDSVLRLADALVLPKGVRWNNQKVRLTLKVPIGKTIKLNENAGWHIRDAKVYETEANEADDYDQSFHDSHTYRMTNAGLDCLDCNNKKTYSSDDNDTEGNEGSDKENKGEFKIKGDFEIDEKGVRIKANKDSVNISM